MMLNKGETKPHWQYESWRYVSMHWLCMCVTNTVKCGPIITHSIFSKNTHNRHHIPHPQGWAMGCLLWGQKYDLSSTFLIIVLYAVTCYDWTCRNETWGGHFKKTYELINLGALKSSLLNKLHIFQCMGKIFWVEFQRAPLKFHTKYLTIENLRAFRFTSVYTFLKCTPTGPLFDPCLEHA